MKIVLSIAGSDSGGGAGIQGDVKTITTNGAYAVTAVAALSAQNTQGEKSIFKVSPEFLSDQLDAIFTDLTPDAVKVGMMYDPVFISLTAQKLKQYNAKNVVVDPVRLPRHRKYEALKDDVLEALKEELLPIADVITPDVEEAKVLTGMEIETERDLINATKLISETYNAIVVTKGGRKVSDARDLLFRDGYYKWFPGKVSHNPNRHGIGAAFSCALAVNLAKGYDADKAFKLAKDYLTVLLDDGMALGSGIGPVNHCAVIEGKFTGMLSDAEIAGLSV